jgi:hypothetical protein
MPNRSWSCLDDKRPARAQEWQEIFLQGGYQPVAAISFANTIPTSSHAQLDILWNRSIIFSGTYSRRKLMSDKEGILYWTFRLCLAYLCKMLLPIRFLRMDLSFVGWIVYCRISIYALAIVGFLYPPAFGRFKAYLLTTFDLTKGMRQTSAMKWEEIERDNWHVVISSKPLGEIVVINVMHRTTFSVTGAPAQFNRQGARF